MKKWAAEVVREQLGVPGCRSLIRLDKEIRGEDEEPSLETRYFVSSLDPDDLQKSSNTSCGKGGKMYGNRNNGVRNLSILFRNMLESV